MLDSGRPLEPGGMPDGEEAGAEEDEAEEMFKLPVLEGRRPLEPDGRLDGVEAGTKE